MRFLLVFLVLLVVAWRWRTWRESQGRIRESSEPDTAVASDMVRCAQCGLHVPTTEAVVGTLGSYCSSDHRHLLEP